MRVLLIALLAAISYAQTECEWNYGIPTSVNAAHNGNDRRRLIVNGDTSEPNEYPWHVDLIMGCGATLIGREWVITAAHCFEDADPLNDLKPPITCTDGSQATQCTGHEGEDVWCCDGNFFCSGASCPDRTPQVGLKDKSIQQTAIAVHIHPNYGNNPSNAVKYDIALIQIEPLDCTQASDNGISAIQILDLSNGFDINECTAFLVGYGALFSGASTPPEMLEVITKVHDYKNCNLIPEMILGSHVIDDAQICTYVRDTYEDTCQGDSGGPVYIDTNTANDAHHYVDIGVVSYGQGCGNTQPGIYTKISSYKEWIQEYFADAPFVTTDVCDKGDYNEGESPEVAQSDPQYTPAPMYDQFPSDKISELNSCEIRYLTQDTYDKMFWGTRFDSTDYCSNLDHCKVCDWEGLGCLFCDDGYEVQLPLEKEDNYLGQYNPEDQCTGTCVPIGTNEQNNQASALAAFKCSGNACLATVESGGTVGSWKLDSDYASEAGAESDTISLTPPTDVDPNTLPLVFAGKDSCEDTSLLTETGMYYVPEKCVQDDLFGGYSVATCMSESEVRIRHYLSSDCRGDYQIERTFGNRVCGEVTEKPSGFTSAVELVFFGAPCNSDSTDGTDSTSDGADSSGDGDSGSTELKIALGIFLMIFSQL